MTNGDKIQELFPNAQIDIGELSIYVWLDHGDATEFTDEWWNSEYKEPTIKNDLGVDCISRQAVLEQAYAYGNGLEPDGYCVNVEDIQALPSVTPQEPTDKNFTKADIDAIVKAINEGWELRVKEVLDKIRAEIKEWYWQADKQALAKDPCVVDAMIDLFIRTIDKYKAERSKEA